MIGNGNVTIDIMRILGKDVDSLRETDMSEKALEEKRSSRLKNMVVLGRRGIV